ncbi:hypothetical protein [uncultured Jatrophihabitans sp.]|uniref:hypothetical protein n=1 Tax=uncultured Jatrophihabitans sp. TaxID=1610747 RepID=UPI0035CC81DE
MTAVLIVVLFLVGIAIGLFAPDWFLGPYLMISGAFGVIWTAATDDSTWIAVVNGIYFVIGAWITRNWWNRRGRKKLTDALAGYKHRARLASMGVQVTQLASGRAS